MDETVNQDFLNTLDELKNDIPEELYENEDVFVYCDKPECHKCDLTWIIVIGGKDVSHYIPKELRTNSMNTYNLYSTLRSDSYDEYDEEYGGLQESEWISENIEWLNEISLDPEIHKKLFQEIQKQEFTGCAECGGCT